MPTPRKLVGELTPRGPTEAEFTRQVCGLARLLRYRVAHFRAARTATGWVTPMMGDVGFPDVVITGHGWLIVAELKVGKGRPTTDQTKWLDEFRKAGVLTYLWTPADWDQIESTLKGLAK